MTALELLGYTPCHHFKKDVMDPGYPYRESKLWQQACALDVERRQNILRSIYAKTGCQAAVDYPTSNFVDDLVEMYPDAKVGAMLSSIFLLVP